MKILCGSKPYERSEHVAMMAASVPATSPAGTTQITARLQERQEGCTQTNTYRSAQARGSSLVGQGTVSKLSLQRLKPAIHKYLKVLDIELQRLQLHQCNMDRLTKKEHWTQLHKEQLNATGTVQQIAACLQQLQCTRSQVVDNQLNDLHTMLLRGQEFSVKVIRVLHSFLLFCQGKEPECDISGQEGSIMGMPLVTGSSMAMPDTTRLPTAQDASEASPICPPHATPDNTCEIFANCPDRGVPDVMCAAVSRDQLRQEIQNLYTRVQHFVQTISTLVEPQMEACETAENGNNGNMASVSMENKKSDKTSKLKMAVLPVVGALLGGAVAGPVGVFTGIKIGTLAGGVGGGVAAFATGTILSSHKKKNTSANVNHLENIDVRNAAETFNNNHMSSSLQPESSQNANIIHHASKETHTSHGSVPHSASEEPPPTTLTAHRGVVDPHEDNNKSDDGDDDNGNSLSFWDQIFLWGQAPPQPQ